MEMKNLFNTDLPFREIIQGNFIYADKTGYIYDILNYEPTSFCFLSRPRRFGKKLLLNTFYGAVPGRPRAFQRPIDRQEGLQVRKAPGFEL
jgi:hypothetical protein